MCLSAKLKLLAALGKAGLRRLGNCLLRRTLPAFIVLPSAG
jgi:hypothetical protein